MRGVLEEPDSQLSHNRLSPQNIDDIANQLARPTISVSRQSKSLDIQNNTISVDKDSSRLSPTNILREMREKCSISPVLSDGSRDKKAAKKNWRKRILERKSGQGKIGSSNLDESLEYSFENDPRDLKDMSFESTSSRSSAGLRSTQVSFSCDSSVDASDQEQQHDARSPNRKKTEDSSDPEQLADKPTIKKDKMSKRERLKRMITRPLRRSQSECCEKDIPSHALFLDSKGNKNKETMESRAMDLLLYQRLFGSSNDEDDQTQSPKFHKTFSADSALAESGDEVFNNHTQLKQKPRNLAKNMKKKFQFLRRQHTDTVVDQENALSLFNLASYDQASQWSRSLDDLLRDKSGLEIFLGFLRSEFSEENLEFWIACEEYRTSNEHDLEAVANKIYNEFVVSKAPKEVNLDADTKMETSMSLESPTRDTFDSAQHKIQALMAKDSYPRFLESELYQYILGNLSNI